MTAPETPSFSFSWLSVITTPVKWGLGFLQARTPLRASISVGGRPVTIIVIIINKTKDFPLHVHDVRIHAGFRAYTYFFRLAPTETITIAPRARQAYFLPFEHTIVGRRYETKQMPNLNADDSGPTFDSPADLFKSIARSKPNESWLEIDFNEFTSRIFLKGEVQPMFHNITKMPPPKINEE